MMENTLQARHVVAHLPHLFLNPFRTFLVGQTISNIGSAFTSLALPLLIFKLTGSALNLAIATGVTFLPYLLFGLVIGAWVDRTNRKRVMIIVDTLRALLLGTLALLLATGYLWTGFIYVTMFISSTLAIYFTAAQFAAVPHLAAEQDLVIANGRLQAGYSTAMVVGPLIASALVAVLAVHTLLVFDALSFLVSVCSLLLIRGDFNVARQATPTSLRQDISEGLRYVFAHPVLRSISLMLLLIIFLVSNTQAQLVVFAKEHVRAGDAQVGLFYMAGGLGYLLFSLVAGKFAKHVSMGTAILGAVLVKGVLITLLGLLPWYGLALILWGLSEGMTMLFNINTMSLRQTVVPPQMLGRVLSIAQVLAWCAIPVGTFMGGLVVEWTHNVALVYESIGILTCGIVAVFWWFTPLGRADLHVPEHRE